MNPLRFPGWGYLMAAVLALVLAPGGGWGTVSPSAAGEPSRQVGFLVGKATLGPLEPLGPMAGGPAVGVRVIARDVAGQERGQAVTDAQGGFRLALPPGIYVISPGPLPPLQFTKDLPASVEIKAGQETRLNFHVDTGLR
jgi:hypothetical protein